jgi:hypothetical protein
VARLNQKAKSVAPLELASASAQFLSVNHQQDIAVPLELWALGKLLLERDSLPAAADSRQVAALVKVAKQMVCQIQSAEHLL